jgi:hypothetical protein
VPGHRTALQGRESGGELAGVFPGASLTVMASWPEIGFHPASIVVALGPSPFTTASESVREDSRRSHCTLLRHLGVTTCGRR